VGVILDSCIWVALAGGTLKPQGVIAVARDAPVFVSAISLGELSFGVQVCTDPAERAQRAAYLQQVERRPILNVSRHTAAAFGVLAAGHRGPAITTCGLRHRPSNTGIRS